MHGGYFSTGTLAQVATVLAKEYGVRVQIGGTKAYTGRDSETNKWCINVPAIATNDEYYMDVMRCYLDHEAGHVRFSDMNLLEENTKNMTYLLKSVWNIFEDIYIERKMSRSFPGCARNLRVGAEHIFSEDIRVPEDSVSALLSYILLKSRYNATNIKVFESGIDMLGNLLPSDLQSVVDGYIDKLPSCNSTKATMDLAKEVCAALNKYVKDNTSNDCSCGDSTSDASEAASSLAESIESSQSDVTGELGDIGLDSAMSKSSAGSAACKKELADIDIKEALLEALVAANTSGSYDGNSYDMSDRVNKMLSDVNSVDAGSLGSCSCSWEVMKSIDEAIRKGLDKYVGKLSNRYRNDALKESAKLSSQLTGLLQTMVMNRGGFATRGKLDSKRIARVAVGRPDIFSSHVDKRGLDTEVIIAVDASGSMSGYDYYNGGRDRTKMLVANQSLVSILTALKSIQGVRSMAYVYSDYVIHVCGFTDTFNANSRVIVQTFGGTPTGDAVQHAMTLFTPNARRRILILLTDGEPDDNDYFKASVRLLKKQGIEIVGIGIMDDSLSRDMSEEEHIIVYDLSELSPKLFKILRDKLVRNA